MRGIASVIGGLIAGIIVMMLVSFVGGLLFPMNVPVDLGSAEAVGASFSAASSAAQLVVVLSWFAGALGGAVTAKKIARASWAAWTVAIIYAVYVLLSVFVLPMPGWMQVLAVALPLVAGLIASRMRVEAPASSDAGGQHAEI